MLTEDLMYNPKQEPPFLLLFQELVQRSSSVAPHQTHLGKPAHLGCQQWTGRF